jgi:hypothetical protein
MNKLLFFLVCLLFAPSTFAQNAQCNYTYIPIIQEQQPDPFSGPIPVQTGQRLVQMAPCTATTNAGQFYGDGQVIQPEGGWNAACKFSSGLTLPCGD